MPPEIIINGTHITFSQARIIMMALDCFFVEINKIDLDDEYNIEFKQTCLDLINELKSLIS
jgi:hypothetical protein